VDTVRKMLYGALDDCLTALNPKSAKQQQQQADSIRLVYAKWVAKHCPEVVPIDTLCMSDADGEALLPAFSSIYEECRAASDAGGIQFPYMMLASEFEIQKDTFSQVFASRRDRTLHRQHSRLVHQHHAQPASPDPMLCSLQAGGWLRGNREGIETLIDSTKGMLELVNSVSTLPYTCKDLSASRLTQDPCSGLRRTVRDNARSSAESSHCGQSRRRTTPPPKRWPNWTRSTSKTSAVRDHLVPTRLAFLRARVLTHNTASRFANVQPIARSEASAAATTSTSAENRCI
jgi:hypothetical protein